MYGVSPVVGSSTNTPSPWSRIQSGPALSMLKKLVSESDSNFIAVHEEVSCHGNVLIVYFDCLFDCLFILFLRLSLTWASVISL